LTQSGKGTEAQRKVKMKRTRQLLFALMVLLLMGESLGAEDISSKEVYVSPFIGLYDLENDLGLHVLWGVRGGRLLSDQLVVEGWLAKLVDDTKTPGGEREGWYLHRVDLLYFPWKHKTIYPFLAGGIGGIRFDLEKGNEMGLITDWGGGIKWPIPLWRNLDIIFRADARYLIRSLRGDISFGQEATIGLSFQWTSTQEKAKPLISEKQEGEIKQEEKIEQEEKIKQEEEIEQEEKIEQEEEIKQEEKIEQEEEIKEAQVVGFVSGSAMIPTDQEKVLDALVERLQKYPKTDLELTGYTDALGTKLFNMELSLRRALAVKEYLVLRGIAPERITLIGGGQLEDPIESDLTNEGRAENRRVTIRIKVED